TKNSYSSISTPEVTVMVLRDRPRISDADSDVGAPNRGRTMKTTAAITAAIAAADIHRAECQEDDGNARNAVAPRTGPSLAMDRRTRAASSAGNSVSALITPLTSAT